ncbi:MAG: DUF1549 domain-containing protein [Verrucomicrobiae bacterium]|nr:DUF1549 domain-containing protein [Verrucomicrobiae bacterium]
MASTFRKPAFTAALMATLSLGQAFAADTESDLQSRISDRERDYWFFQPLHDSQAPQVKDSSGWVKNEIDRFVLAKLEAKNISPAPEADARSLIRRAYFDLTGLPPTFEQIEAFEKAYAADKDKAVATLIDELLESPQYGERWGRIWLDLVRYGDSDGYKADGYRPHMWRYRDWVIRALNQDMPYDQFVRWQLAGDEIAPENPDAVTATGYLRLWPYEWNQRDAPNQWNIILEDITDITGPLLMGLSMGCAKCHDHKFDPILQDDYFRMQAFFTGVFPDDTVAATPEQKAAYDAQMKKWETATADIRKEMEEMIAAGKKSSAAGLVKMFSPELQKIYNKPEAEKTAYEKQLSMLIRRQADDAADKAASKLKDDAKKRYNELEAKLKTFDEMKPKSLPEVYAIRDVQPDIPPAKILDEPERTFRPGFLTVLKPEPVSLPAKGGPSKDSSGARTAFANWVTRPDNQLSTRVMANRLWHYHFGAGIVESSNDFGKQGQLPTHPELLDWLAQQLPAKGWSLKAMHRLIMNSATWRQAAVVEVSPEALAGDPANHLLWHQRIRRLEAEQIRDAALSVGAELDPKMYGEGVTGESTKRRAIYQRMMRNPRTLFLNTFDGPDGFSSCARRDVTTTAPQALAMLNNGFVNDRAATVAKEALEAGDTSEAIDRAFELVLGRQPDAEELSQAEAFLDAQASEAAKPLSAESGGMPEPKVKTTAFKDFPKNAYSADQAVNVQPDSLYERVEVRGLPRHEGNTFTVQAVISLDSLYADASVRTIAGRWSGNSSDLDVSGYGWSFGITSEKSRYQPKNLIFQIVGEDIAGNPRYEVIASDLRIPTQTPYYIAAVVETGSTKEGGIITFYAKDLSDPKAKVQTAIVPHPFAGTISRPERRLFFGGRDQRSSMFDGAIARFVLTDRALSEQELLIGKNPTGDALVAGVFPEPKLEKPFARTVPVAMQKELGQPTDPRFASFVDLSLALLNSNEFLYID